MKFFRIHISLFLFLAAVLLGSCPGRVKGPGIQFKTEKHDFGTIAERAIFDFSFEYVNNGTEPLVIEGVLSTCGCTFLKDYDREVQPGQSGRITGTFNSTGLDGKVTRNVLVGTNVPGRENITLIIEGTVNAGPAAVSSIEVEGAEFGAEYERVQAGETAIGSSDAATRQVKVAFAEAFSRTPKIVATVRNDPGWDVDDTFAVRVSGVSGTHFTATIVRVDQAHAWSQSPLLAWMAWE